MHRVVQRRGVDKAHFTGLARCLRNEHTNAVTGNETASQFQRCNGFAHDSAADAKFIAEFRFGWELGARRIFAAVDLVVQCLDDQFGQAAALASARRVLKEGFSVQSHSVYSHRIRSALQFSAADVPRRRGWNGSDLRRMTYYDCTTVAAASLPARERGGANS